MELLKNKNKRLHIIEKIITRKGVKSGQVERNPKTR